ncbi:MAG: hypothetical protein ABFS86_17450 [Planctomycetota bacterium]
MRILTALIVLIAIAAPLAGAAEKKPVVTVEAIRADLAKIRPRLVEAIGLAWPEGLEVELVDRAGMRAILLEEFRRDVPILFPERPERSQRILAEMYANSLARVTRAKYGLISKKIHVSTGAVDELPKSLDRTRVLTFILAHEAVHAMDDRAFGLSALLAGAPDPEAHRALNMVIEGRAEHWSAQVAPHLGVPAEVDRTLVARRDPAMRRLRDAGRRFVASIEKRDPDLLGRMLVEPPRTTSTVFHPDRYGRPFDPPDAVATLVAAKPKGKVEPLSELHLRNRLGERMKDPEIEKMFAGYLAGAAVVTPRELRVSLTEHDSAAAAKAFLAGLMAFEGQAAGESATFATGPLAHPDGRKFKWWAWLRGPRVIHVVGPADVDVLKELGPTLAPPPREK